jgi:hypothetical protein
MSVIDRLEVENGYAEVSGLPAQLSDAEKVRRVCMFIAEGLLGNAAEWQACDCNENPRRAAELRGRLEVFEELRHLMQDPPQK